MTAKKLRIILAIGFLSTLALIVYFSYAAEEGRFILDGDRKNSIRFEIIKSLLQLLVIIIIGGIISALFKSLDASREQSKIKLETWKEYLRRIAHNYQNVKLARRALIAGGLTAKYGNAPTSLSQAQLNLYIEQIEILNKSQIELEALKIEARYLPDFILFNNISENLGSAEDYLREIVKEYEAKLPLFMGGQLAEFNSLERLTEFTTSTKTKTSDLPGNTGYRFRSHFAEPFDEILKTFTRAFT